MLVLYFTFLLEILKYWFGCYAYFSIKLKINYNILIGLIIFPFIIYFFDLNMNETHLVMYILTILILLTSMDSINYQKCIKVFILMFVISSMDELFGIIFNQFYTFLEKFFLINLEYLFSSLLSLLIILLFIYIRNHKRNFIKFWIKKTIKERSELFVIIMSMSVLLSIAGLMYARKFIENDRFVLFSTIISVLAYFSSGMLGIFLIYIKNSNEKLEQLFETEIKIKEIQEQYYKTLLEKEEDTRKYRHDINNHIICIKDFAENEKIEEIKNYITLLQDKLNIIHSKNYSSGNDILDIFVNYYLQDLRNDVTFTSIGKFKYNLEISNVDTCTIFANLLQNSVQALSIAEGNNHFLSIEIRQGEIFSKIQIKNSYTGEYRAGASKGSRNHGLGLKNVREAIERNGGIFLYSKDKGIFTAEVTLIKQQQNN